MVKSMTGFGRGRVTRASQIVTVEISTVNRKQFDASIWLPREWMAFEVPLLNLLKRSIIRGAVKCTVNVKPFAENENTDRLGTRFATVKRAAEQLGITTTPSLSDLVTLLTADDVISVPEPSDALWDMVEEATREALTHLTEMRCHEGERIATDLRQRFERLHTMFMRIQAIAPVLPQQFRDTLKKRIDELLTDGRHLDEGILEREVALFADRCDISEELTRLDAHFVHAETLLAGDAPCGRPLDFLCQEFFREINTTGSKCASNEISHLVIEFKTLLETVREQVQNLE